MFGDYTRCVHGILVGEDCYICYAAHNRTGYECEISSHQAEVMHGQESWLETWEFIAQLPEVEL